MIALIPKELFFSACVPQAESLIYWCAETSGSVNPRSWERKRKVAIQSAKKHRDVSQSCLLHIQSQPVVHWHYSHKTPLCRAAVWAGIAIAWWKLECFFNIDFCWEGWEENHVEVRNTEGFLQTAHINSSFCRRVPSGHHAALPHVCFVCSFSLLVPVMDIGLIHYRTDFCHTLLQPWVNYETGGKRIRYSWAGHDQTKSNKSDDYLFDKQRIRLWFYSMLWWWQRALVLIW